MPMRLEPLKAVLKNYPITIKKITAENYKGKKGVWWVETDKGLLVLKKMPDARKVPFLLAAAGHLSRNGVKIPPIIPAKDGALYVLVNHAPYLLSKAIIARNPNYQVPSELKAVMQGMAQFHKASKGFQAPPQADFRSHLGTWPQNYAKQLQELTDFKTIANGKKPFDMLFLANVDLFLKQGWAALANLKASAYDRWTKQTALEKGFCHQDYAAGNLGLTAAKELYVFDLDSVTYDIPARDLRKIINKVMKKRKRWSADLAARMLSWYHSVNPLVPEEYQVLMIDLQFPHLFHGIVSKYFQGRDREWSQQKFLQRLKETINTEQSKEALLKHSGTIIHTVTGRNPYIH